jgi:iron-sulfur cluster assembly protein/NifU-like protein
MKLSLFNGYGILVACNHYKNNANPIRSFIMITLTDNAVKAVGRFIASSGKPSAGLRIEVTDGGCSGLQYGLKLDEQTAAADTVIDCGDVKVLVDADSMPKLDGMSIDFVDSLEGSGFKFSNPNAVKSCACGSSFNTCS